MEISQLVKFKVIRAYLNENVHVPAGPLIVNHYIRPEYRALIIYHDVIIQGMMMVIYT